MLVNTLLYWSTHLLGQICLISGQDSLVTCLFGIAIRFIVIPWKQGHVYWNMDT